MNELAEEGSRRKRRFSEEFKRDAVRLIVEEGYTFKSAATAVGVSDQSLRAWHAKFAPVPEACGEQATVFRKLRRILGMRRWAILDPSSARSIQGNWHAYAAGSPPALRGTSLWNYLAV